MSCYQCCQSFGIFNKERSCKRCKFSMCSKCLKYKTQITELNNEVHSICQKCYNIIQGKQNEIILDPPKNLKMQSTSNITKKTGDFTDLENRLNNLKSAEVKPATTEELEKRLKNLRGISCSDDKNKDSCHKFYVKPKTEQEQLKELMAQMNDEVNLNSKDKTWDKGPDDALNDRLKKLKNGMASKDFAPVPNNDYLNSSRIVEKILDEIAIENKFDTPNSVILDSVVNEELPYCCLCSEDALWRCHDCDEDLYCDGCFKHCHSKKEYGPHNHEKYKHIK